MKRLTIFTVIFAFAGTAIFWTGKPATTPPAEKGIHFENITFNHALQEAQKEHKLIFMNVYATWCAPCKLLMKTTFTDDKVGSVFNKNFVNISIDAEKGEGIALAKKYKVQAHPLMLVLNSKGNVVKRILGYMTDEQLLAQVKGLTK